MQHVRKLLMNISARSVRSKTTNVLDLIHEHDLDSVAITEIWLTNKDSNLTVTRDHPRSSRPVVGNATIHK